MPIRPGTDAAFLLSMANLMVNEYDLYDKNYLKRNTNAPYLIDNSGRYVRDRESQKPLIWHPTTERALVFDDPSASDFALDGVYEVGDVVCRPSFQALRDHLKTYTPEYAENITTVPKETTRRIAKEFGGSASIGATIEIGGKVLPFRPAACVWYRGLSAHSHSMLSGMAAELLDVLVGAVDVPGGLLASGQMPYVVSEDGLISAAPGSYFVHPAYPPRKVIPPLSQDLFELLPVACYSRPFFIFGMLEPEKYKSSFSIDMVVQVRANFAKTSVSRNVILQLMKKIPFFVSFNVDLDETSQFADIVFPDLHYLERVGTGLEQTRMLVRSGKIPDKWYAQKPAMSPGVDSPWGEKFISNGLVFLELAKRAGFLEEMYKTLNFVWQLKEPYKLLQGKEYEFEELIDRYLRSMLGDAKGWSWFLEDGLNVSERSPEEMYPGAFRRGRTHLYYEFMIEAGKEVDKVTHELGIPWDSSDYLPLPEWKPCPSYEKEKSKEFDLFLVNYKIPQQGFSLTDSKNNMLQNLTDRHRDNDILINPDTARTKGIADGDVILIENTVGSKSRGRARMSELVHPEVVACQGSAGRFAKGGRNDTARGIHFNDMVIFDSAHVDYVTAALDSCVRVQVCKE